eukprot:15341614-Ditylum_brightwellii.AAC.1
MGEDHVKAFETRINPQYYNKEAYSSVFRTKWFDKLLPPGNNGVKITKKCNYIVEKEAGKAMAMQQRK